jgi:hypothetical protein
MGSALRGSLSGAAAPGGDLFSHPWPRRALLAAAGLGCGISPAFFGYFDLSLWGPIAIALTVVAIALLLARQAVPRGIAALAVLGLLAFAAWCLLSLGWAESGDRALSEGDRWILYGLYLLVLLLLIADRQDAEVLLGATVAGILCIGAYDLVRMLDGEGRELFSGSRLLEPLGYVNALGGFFLLGFWPLLAVAERACRPLPAGIAAGSATILAALVVLTDSRGTLFAFIASAAVLLALLPGRSRRAWAILAVLAGLLVAWGPLTDVTREMPGGLIPQPPDTIRRGAEWALFGGAGVAILWGLATWLVDSLAASSGSARKQLPRASVALLVAIALAALAAAAVAINDPIGRLSAQYEAFTKLEPVKGASRFTSGGGNRYDYWRIAWNQFLDHPLDGVGAGNFDRTYFLERRTNEDVRQAGAQHRASGPRRDGPRGGRPAGHLPPRRLPRRLAERGGGPQARDRGRSSRRGARDVRRLAGADQRRLAASDPGRHRGRPRRRGNPAPPARHRAWRWSRAGQGPVAGAARDRPPGARRHPPHRRPYDGRAPALRGEGEASIRSRCGARNGRRIAFP